jgi:hypothetical protein
VEDFGNSAGALVLLSFVSGVRYRGLGVIHFVLSDKWIKGQKNFKYRMSARGFPSRSLQPDPERQPG